MGTVVILRYPLASLHLILPSPPKISRPGLVVMAAENWRTFDWAKLKNRLTIRKIDG